MISSMRPSPGRFAIENDRRASSSAGDPDVDVLAGQEVEVARLGHLQFEPPDVVRERLDRGDGRAPVADLVLQLVVVRVEVQQLDDQVLLRHRAAQQRVAVRLLGLREGERRVRLQHHLAFQQICLAGRALALAAAVHEVVPVPEGRVEDRLLLVAVDLLADRLEDDARTHRASESRPACRCRCRSTTAPPPSARRRCGRWETPGRPTSRSAAPASRRP